MLVLRGEVAANAQASPRFTAVKIPGSLSRASRQERPTQADGIPEMADDARDMSVTPITPPIVQARPVRHPLGPLVVWQRVEHPLAGRLYAILFAMGGLAILATAVWMTPDRSHMGTHRQLCLPACAFVSMTGFPCPTCGMTTAFSFIVHGHPIEAARSSVFGLLLAILTVVMTLAALSCVVTARYPNLNWYRVDAVKLVYFGALMLVASWGLKIVIGLHDGSLPVK